MKERLDVLLVNNGLAETREKAKRTIMSGLVPVDVRHQGKPCSRSGIDSEVQVKGQECPYVSRGGLKLEQAINEWGVSCDNAVCIDMGASTGGFTDCMLQHGARKVYARDIGVAFQILDDILDIEGDQALLGKTLGKDAEQGKCNYAFVHGPEAARAELHRLTSEAKEALSAYGDAAAFFTALADSLEIRKY